MIAHSNQNSSSKEKEKQEKSNDIIVKPIVYGSIAFWLGKKADETVSHKWCVYVRGLNNEDISYFVKEVVFTLHSSFNNHVRVVNKFPFELYEVGWGQFDIIITIHLVDETAKPIEFLHHLKLYPNQPHASMSTKKPVVSESYDEIIFVNPEPHLREILLNPPQKKESSNIQIAINPDEDRKSQDQSVLSQDDKISNQFDKPPSLKKEQSFKSDPTFDNKMDVQMDSQTGMTPSFQQKIEDLNIATNYKVSGTFLENFDKMHMNADMIVDSGAPAQKEGGDTVSMISNSMMDVEKKPEEKKYNNYIPNVSQFYQPIDDTVHYKILEDANKFVQQEIARLKKHLEDTDRDIVNMKKNIKNFIQS